MKRNNPMNVTVTTLVPGYTDAHPIPGYGTIKELWWSSVRWTALRKMQRAQRPKDCVRPSIL